MDETTIAGGNFFVTGPDFDTWSGPDLQLWLDAPSVGTESEVLQSPALHGIVQGDITFQRIALDSLTVVSGIDTVGSGHLYRTKAIFAPSISLGTSTEYTVHLSGDDDTTDDVTAGIWSRTVFDAVASGVNTGTGAVVFTGGYIGLAPTDTFHVTITTGGAVGAAKFTYYADSDPSAVYGPFKTKQSGVLLQDGITAAFSDATYDVGDKFFVVVKSPTVFTGTTVWPFKTGSGAILVLPTTTATSILGEPASATPTSASSTFSVLSTDPADGASNIVFAAGDYNVAVTFSSNIDSSTVVSGVDLSIVREAVTGEGQPVTLNTSPSVSGSTLTIVVNSGVFSSNSFFTVMLNSTIAGTNGVTLGSDYEFSFSTEYSPLYSTLRRLRLLVGAHVTGIPDDTINLAIHVASLEAGNLTWNIDNLTDAYYIFARGQWVSCRAAQIILLNAMASGGALKSKQLGDLRTDYDTSTSNLSVPLKRVEDCLLKWEGVLLAGGRQVQGPKMTIKGEDDPDRITVGRMWRHEDGLAEPPAANLRATKSGSRRYTRGWWQR